MLSSLFPMFSVILRFTRNHILIKTLTLGHCTCVLIEHKHTSFFSGIYYYQEDFGDKIFKSFWKKFLPKGYVAKELKRGDPSPNRLFLVFFLPSVNRQNNVDVVSDFIKRTMDKLKIRGNCN